MIISLITSEFYHTLHLPERCEGIFDLKDQRSHVLFRFYGTGDGWRPEAGEGCKFTGSLIPQLRDGMLVCVRIHDQQEEAYLCAEADSPGYSNFIHLAAPDQIYLSIGADADNSIVCTSPHISDHHCALICSGREWAVKDLASRTGTFVNGKRIQEKKLTPGDMISVMNQKIITLPGMIVMNRPWKKTRITVRTLSPLPEPSIRMEDGMIEEKNKVWFRRSPRFVEEVQETEMEVLNPLRIKQGDDTPALLSFGPAVTSGLSMFFAGMANPIFGLGMMASSILWPSLQKRRGAKLLKAQNDKNQQLYTDYLKNVEEELDRLALRQSEALIRANPAPLDEARNILDNHSLLWNRRTDQPDCLNIRLGSGDLPVQAKITLPKENPLDDSDEPMNELLKRLREQEHLLKDVPIALNLADYTSIGVTGNAPDASQTATKLVIQTAMHLGYDELKLALIGKTPGPMKALRFLPHTWTDDGSTHLTAGNEEELNRLLPKLDQLLADMESCQPRSHLVVLITDPRLARIAALDRLLFQASSGVVHVISMAGQHDDLPRRTDAVVSVTEGEGLLTWQGNEKRETQAFHPDVSVMPVLEEITALLANTFLEKKEDAYVLPKMIPFLNLFHADRVEQLNLAYRWDQSDPTRTLICPIGISEDGTLCTLDLHEKADGPHGLVAGMTGSGKSEALMTLILSLAVCFNPEEVAFVMIDYKGGGMAQAFEHLPHTAGIITNLDGNEIQRSLLSIQSEMDRRQRLFTQAQRDHNLRKMDIYDYQRLYREKQVSEPVPHLVIISDEFAELKTQEPEFLQQLIRAARIGRSLGIHLILATQKPAGVVDDQIWSNTNFRICLRVQSSRDSQEVLKGPEAAELTNVGSMYKQVGSGRTMIKAQSAWTGADYLPDGSDLPECSVEVLDANGGVIRAERMPRGLKQSGENQLDATVKYIIRSAEASGLRTPRLWLPSLEPCISLAAIRKKYQVSDVPWVPDPVLGELDDPAHQQRQLLRIPLSEGQNSLIYGGFNSGKLMALTTILEDLLLHHDPSELHVYLLDMADEGLDIYREAPQVGDVITSRDEEKLVRFLNFLETEMEYRRSCLSTGGIHLELKERLEQNHISRIVVVIHAADTLQNRLEYDLPRLAKLLSEGPRYGIHFIATVQNAGGLRFQIQQHFPQRYVLQMDLEEDYITILGRTGGMKPSQIRGRGLVRDEQIFEFQTATADEANQALLFRQLKENWHGELPPAIRVLPDQVSLAEMLPFLQKDIPLRLPIGYDMSNVEPAIWKLDERVVHLMLGDALETESLMEFLSEMMKQQGGYASILRRGEPESETVIHQLFERCKVLRDQESSDESKPTLVMIPSMQHLKAGLPEEAWEELDAMIWKAKPKWKYTFILGDTAKGFEKFRFPDGKGLNRWFTETLDVSNGLIIGESNNQTLIQLSTYLRNESPWPCGHLIQSGKARKVKLIAISQSMS